MSFKSMRMKFGTKRTADFGGLVSRKGVNDNYVICNAAQRRKATADISFLIEGDDDGR